MKQTKYLILFLLVFLFRTTTHSQNDSLKRHGIGFGIGLYQYPFFSVSYSRKLKYPKFGDDYSVGLEIIQHSNQTYSMLTNGISFNLYKTKNSFKIGSRLTSLTIPTFLYTKTGNVANLGCNPELNIGYKNFSIGYQYIFSSFQKIQSDLGDKAYFFTIDLD
jgi:hypothetical protein